MDFEERHRKCTDRLEEVTMRHFHNVQTTLDWSAEMRRRGLMSDEVARALVCGKQMGSANGSSVSRYDLVRMPDGTNV